MDVLKIIVQQIIDLKEDEKSTYLDQILNHLDRAQLYFTKGAKDDHYFNDVVYRTNQAFEGALKEAYKILGDKSDSETLKVSPFVIEKYLRDNNIFKDRVLNLFENYRQEWRNKSTHDYKFLLDETDAFLALVNVSSFVYLLLKQIQEKVSYNKEIARDEQPSIKVKTSEIAAHKEYALVEKVLSLLKVFHNEAVQYSNESEIVGRLYGFLEKSVPNLTVLREPVLGSGRFTVRPDFIIKMNDERILIEIKRLTRANESNYLNNFRAGIDQITSYLTLTGIKDGIIYVLSPKSDGNKLIIDTTKLNIEDTEYNISVLY